MRWLREIHDYIAQDKPEEAFRVIESLYRRAQIFSSFRRVGHLHRSASGREVRILLGGHYRIVDVERGDDEVHVVGVFHGGMALKQYVP